MSEKTNKALVQEQKTTKPNIEDVIGNFLEGDALKNALEFIAFLRENNMNPRWASTNAWSVVGKKSKTICQVRLGGGAKLYLLEAGEWAICLLESCGREYLDAFLARDEMKAFIWASVKPCTRCCSCGPKRNRTYAGKTFDECCGLRIKNPDAEGLEYAKMIVAANKRFVSGGA